MAAKFKPRAIAGIIGKRFVDQISVGGSKNISVPLRSVANYSSYEKNVEDHVRPVVVPDHVIESKSDKYWGPHPETGVFGPADPTSCGGAGRIRAAPATTEGSNSVLDQTAWFRPLEDVEKPPPLA